MLEMTDVTLAQRLDELAAFEPTEYPFVSLYLNTRADQHGRDNFASFVRKEFKARAKTFAPESLELASFERDTARIKKYLRDELRPSANGLAIFACAGADDYFRAVQLDAPVKRHQLHVCQEPYLYPLARLLDQHPRYVALIADTNSARLFVFGMGKTMSSSEVRNVKVSRTQGRGWSQMRYQRHVDNYHLLHAKEVVEMLGRVVREEAADHVVIAGDEVIVPLLREQLPQHLADKVVEVLRLDIRTPEHEILKATMEALSEHNLQTDAERVRRLLDEYRAGGLAVVGVRDTLTALYQGQVDELLLSASAREIVCAEEDFDETMADGDSPGRHALRGREPHLVAADLLVTRARLSGARVTFIEDAALLAGVGGCGALLRYRL
ncbi:MAG TPA: Vms1/Ankzf1 family peptidyl-tRNA hydrolase [Pyrinomonadaceae bacterium]|nr:Vms1/Ankzf1 family peptidyl-tRNA hydrolase [Pyrinomonadaceae bacterium]